MDVLIRRIVVPVDFSPASERAANYAAALARRLGASLHLLHVVEPAALMRGPFELHEHTSPELLDLSFRDTRVCLGALRDRLTHGPVITGEVRYGDPAEVVTAGAMDQRADLVVMATHGRSGVSHGMGRVTERVVRSSPAPVLVVRDCGQVQVHRASSLESMLPGPEHAVT